MPDYQELASYQNCQERIQERWRNFQQMRQDRLRHLQDPERVAECILEDLFTEVLDWSKGDVAYQVDYADMVLTKNLVKYCIVEVKRPGRLWGNDRHLQSAIKQAWEYAVRQQVKSIAVSDGRYLYAADLVPRRLRSRALIDLKRPTPQPSLWWLSVDGIYRKRSEPLPGTARPAPAAPQPAPLLHPKYGLPSTCFAYVGDPNDPSIWKLPYRKADGSVDGRRLPKAIQALITNFRGTKVGGIPEAALPDVFRALGKAAADTGRMPPDDPDPAPVYSKLAMVLRQIDEKAPARSAVEQPFLS